MKKYLAVLIFLSSSSVFAGKAGEGNISNIHFMNNGVVLFYTDGAITSSETPDCAQNQSIRFAIDSTTDGGKSQVSGLLTAYASGKKIKVHGLNNCSVHGDTESLYYFKIID